MGLNLGHLPAWHTCPSGTFSMSSWAKRAVGRILTNTLTSPLSPIAAEEVFHVSRNIFNLTSRLLFNAFTAREVMPAPLVKSCWLASTVFYKTSFISTWKHDISEDSPVRYFGSGNISEWPMDFWPPKEATDRLWANNRPRICAFMFYCRSVDIHTSPVS